MKDISKNWIYVVLGLLVLALLISLFNPTFTESLRIVFGGFYILFLPGFAIVHLFFKDRELIEKIALSFALSIAIVPLTVFYLNFFFKIKITALNTVLIAFAIILITYIIYKFKKH